MTAKLAKLLGFIEEALGYNKPHKNEIKLYEESLLNSGLTRQDLEWCFKKINDDGIIQSRKIMFAPKNTLSTYPKQADFSSAANQTHNKAVYILSIDLAKFKDYAVKPHPEDKPRFDDNNGKIYFNGKECQVPLQTNQFFLCRKMFNETLGKRIKEIDILDLIDWSKDGKRSVYDAMRLTNNRAKENLGIEKLFKWRNNTVWMNETFS